MRHGRTHRTAALAAALILLASAGGCDGSSQEDRSATKGKGKARPSSAPDFNGDGYEDAAVVVTGSAAAGLDWDYGPVVVFRGGPGGLRPTDKPLIAGSGRRANGFLEEGFRSDLTADLNSDGFSDLILHQLVPVPNTQDNQEQGSRTVVFHGGKDGLSTTPVRVHVPGDDPKHPFTALEAADFDGDGHADLYGGERLLMGPFDADGKPKAARRLSGGVLSTAADFDRDGRTDLLVHHDYDDEAEDERASRRSVRYFRGIPGQGLEEDSDVSRRLSEMVGDIGSEVHAGIDFDGDGYPDLLPPGRSAGHEREYVRGGPDGFRPDTARLSIDIGSPTIGTHVLTGHVTSASDRNTVSTVEYGSPDQQGHLQLARLTSRGSAVTMTGLQIIDKGTEGISGDVFESDIGRRDRFAEDLRVLDADRDGHDDVLTFEPFSGPDGRYGGFWLLSGTPDGLRTRDVHRYTMPELGL
ncbi:VCBS repeat-containing protein [Streptomyces sp. NPDC050597]|uniref:FG-GAP repeat domain-containing protein n=1 Tax=Streptomyces sp. NPDC050597 TaxID=3157212 RepID=UPI003417C64A